MSKENGEIPWPIWAAVPILVALIGAYATMNRTPSNDNPNRPPNIDQEEISSKPSPGPPQLVPLKLYWSPERADNFVTATPSGENDALTASYSYIRVEACIFPSQETGTVPLDLYWSAGRGDNFTTATGQGVSDARAARYIVARTEGYVYQEQQPDTVPLNLYWSVGRGDNFTTATGQGANDARAAGYIFVRVEGYVYPASKCQ